MANLESSIQPVEATTPHVPSSGAPPENSYVPTSNRFMIRGIDWATYRKIADALGEHHHYRLSYDGQDLELMTKSKGHGRYGRLLSRFIDVLTEEMGLTLDSCGDMTCDREDVERAIEPDDCFYIQNEPLVRDKEKIDLAVDPPPDLGLEIDLTTDSRRRLGIYAALKVPEVWRYDGRNHAVTIHVLQPDGQYAIHERSRCLPLVGAADLTMFVQRRKNEEENALLKAFREWVRQQINKPQ